MKGWRHALLVFELFWFALILVLPQVDLPDFTFPGGTAPVIVKATLSSPPSFSVVPDPVHVHSLWPIEETKSRGIHPTVLQDPFSAVTLTWILRC